jgi:hypothetical protein
MNHANRNKGYRLLGAINRASMVNLMHEDELLMLDQIVEHAIIPNSEFVQITQGAAQ